MRAGFLFETKEHLGFVAACLGMGGCTAALLAPREAVDLRRAAGLACGCAALLALLATALGVHVSSVHGFGP